MGQRGPQASGKPRDPVVGVRVPPADRDALRRLAAADGAKPSDLAREAIRRYLAARQEDLVAS
jgi:hypothetical protein